MKFTCPRPIKTSDSVRLKQIVCGSFGFILLKAWESHALFSFVPWKTVEQLVEMARKKPRQHQHTCYTANSKTKMMSNRQEKKRAPALINLLIFGIKTLSHLSLLIIFFLLLRVDNFCYRKAHKKFISKEKKKIT